MTGGNVYGHNQENDTVHRGRFSTVPNTIGGGQPQDGSVISSFALPGAAFTSYNLGMTCGRSDQAVDFIPRTY